MVVGTGMTATREIVEAFDTEQETESPVGEALLAAAPIGPDVDEEQLEYAAARHRVLLMRTGAVIALTSLIAIGGALLLHLLAAGVIVIGLLIPWHSPSGGSGHAAGAANSGPGGGALILGNPLADAGPAAAPSAVLPANSAPVPAALSLPPLPAPTASVTVQPPASPETPFTVSDLGTLHIAAPTPVTPAIPANALATASVASVSATPSIGRAGAANATAGSPEGEALFSLNAGDGTKTTGAGGRIIGDPGRGTGNGHDYGDSAASRHARIQRWPDPANIAPKIVEVLRQKKKGVVLQLTIEPDGRVSAVKVAESCGYPDVDELIRADTYATMLWSPAFEQGKPIRSQETYTYDFDPHE